ncbi:transmembrane protein 126A [Neocloeon triangulifer]|uniref:transmembrane protein 126A n=1 Tax=Neocloeon triangulifer TaxID=2078957 RepID=UPI00286F3530|nr:transmembrane protein 126A [Neocloeon triangulifer]XP_059472780.1 transmembrane protein 126A [Neocloeon triangulifer]
MALLHKRDEQIHDLIVLERNEALNKQREILQAWEPQSQLWSVNHSPTILASISALTAMYINNHYRKKMRLFNYGRLSSYLPTVVIPSMITAFGHSMLVQNDVLLRDTRCVLCIQMRCAALQVATSVCYPMVLAPLAALGFAARYRTFIVPNLISAQGRKFAAETWIKFTKPIANNLLAIVAAQGLTASFLAYHQIKTVAMVDVKFAEIVGEEETV